MTIALAITCIGLTCIAQHVQNEAVIDLITKPLGEVVEKSDLIDLSITEEKIRDQSLTWFNLNLRQREGGRWRISIRLVPKGDFGRRLFGGFLPPGRPTPFGETIGKESQTYESIRRDWRSVHFYIGNTVSFVSGHFSREEILTKAKTLAQLLSQREVIQALQNAAQLYETEKAAKKAAEEARKAAEEAAKAVSAEEFENAMAKLTSGNYDKSDERSLLDILRRAKNPAAVPVLIDRIGPDTFYGLRSTAIDALGKIGDKAALPALVKLLERPPLGTDEDRFSEDAIPRRGAVYALRDINDPAAIPLLKRIAANEIPICERGG